MYRIKGIFIYVCIYYTIYQWIFNFWNNFEDWLSDCTYLLLCILWTQLLNITQKIFQIQYNNYLNYHILKKRLPPPRPNSPLVKSDCIFMWPTFDALAMAFFIYYLIHFVAFSLAKVMTLRYVRREKLSEDSKFKGFKQNSRPRNGEYFMRIVWEKSSLWVILRERKINLKWWWD